MMASASWAAAGCAAATPPQRELATLTPGFTPKLDRSQAISYMRGPMAPVAG